MLRYVRFNKTAEFLERRLGENVLLALAWFEQRKNHQPGREDNNRPAIGWSMYQREPAPSEYDYDDLPEEPPGAQPTLTRTTARLVHHAEVVVLQPL